MSDAREIREDSESLAPAPPASDTTTTTPIPRHPEREFWLARWLFLRALGVIFAIAFASLWVQIDGLVGSRGLLPIADFLDRVREVYGERLVRELPTLCWWNASDGFLHAQCAAGLAISIALVAGIAPRLSLGLAWALYLSLSVAGQTFLSFQWDVLLLETAFFAIFFAPGSWVPGLARERAPSAWSLFAVRWLLFRLMFASGAVKLASGDASWHTLTGLTLHYETQPLPTPIAWYAHHLPEWFQRASCAIMFVIELVLPWLVFGPRRARIVAAIAFVIFQALIAITGNYGIFNLLTAALCLPLLDDAWLGRRLPRALSERATRASENACRAARTSTESRWNGSRWSSRLGWAFAVLTALLSGGMLIARIDRHFALPAPLAAVEEWIAPWRTINTYGLFAVMTTERDEIIVEGSRDGFDWKPYEFTYKPGDPRRPPPWVEPHMPRLDWQMWFAALGRARDNLWFQSLMQRLLEGSEPVLRLLAANPFPEAPPRYVRARLERYTFTTAAERAADGAWWSHSNRGLYALPLSRSSSPR
jgi:hypothetical protein